MSKKIDVGKLKAEIGACSAFYRRAGVNFCLATFEAELLAAVARHKRGNFLRALPVAHAFAEVKAAKARRAAA